MGRTKLGKALLDASKRGSLEEVVSLISKGVDVNYHERSFLYDKWTALHFASDRGHIDVVRALLENNADPNRKTAVLNTPLHFACENGYTDVVDLLLQHNSDIGSKNNNSNTPLYLACKTGHRDVVNLLIQNNANINARGYLGGTPLHLACEGGHRDVVDFLIENNADIDSRSNVGCTPLHWACMDGKTDVVDLLLQRGASINIRSRNLFQKPLGYLPNTDAKKFQTRAKLDQLDRDFPDEIRGSKAKRLFRQAMSRGQTEVYHIRVMTVGHYGVGKTTITKALLQDIDRIADTTSTDGIDIHIGKCKIDLETGKWEKRSEDLVKREYLRQRIQQLMYKERRRDITEKKSLNPFSEHFKFKKDTVSHLKKTNKNPNREKSTDVQPSLSDLPSGKEKKSLPLMSPAVKPPAFSKFFSQLHIDNEDDHLSNVVSGNIKEFLPEEKELLPQKDEAIDLKEFTNKMCELEIWDFGGQSVFYTTHQAFLSPRCIYTLAIDGRKSLREKVIDDSQIRGELTSEEIEELLRFWIFSIVTYAKGRVPGFPKIIPVITHMDQIPEAERRGKIAYIFREIERICNEYQVLDHIILDVRLSINALNPDDPAYDVLRTIILEVAKTYPDFGELMPATWVPLEHSIGNMKAAEYKIVPVSCLQEVNMKSEFEPLEEEELRLFLDFQHSLGNILFFSDAHLRHNVIIDPRWLIDALKSIITADRFLQDDKTKEKMSQNLSKSGGLDIALLAELWNTDGYEEFYNNAEYLLHTMVKMDLLAEPVDYDKNGTAIQSSQFIVPSMIQFETSRAVIEKLSPSESSAALLFTFNGKFLPKPIFNRLVASCINLWPLELFDQKSVISSSFCSLRIDVSHRLNIRMLPYQVVATVTVTHTSKSISGRVCGRIRQILLNTLNRICQVHKDAGEESGEGYKKKFFIEVPCCAKHLRCTRKIEDISSDTTNICDHHRDQENFINFTIWIRHNESYTYLQDEDCTSSNPCPYVPDRPLQVKELGRLSRRLHGEPFQIAILLDVDRTLLTNEEDHYKHLVMGKTEFCFRILMKAKDNRLTPKRLKKDLYEADEKNNHVVCKVIRKRMAVIESEIKDEYIPMVPSEEILDQLSSRLTPDEAFHLYIELGLDIVEIDRTRRNFPRETLEQIKHMLRVWRGQTDPEPTFKILAEAITEVGINIKELRQIAPKIMK